MLTDQLGGYGQLQSNANYLAQLGGLGNQYQNGYDNQVAQWYEQNRRFHEYRVACEIRGHKPLSETAIACYRRARKWRRVLRVASAVWNYVKDI